MAYLITSKIAVTPIKKTLFLKHTGALGSHIKFLGAHADRTQRRRGCPSSLETHHTAALTPPHTRPHPTRSCYSTMGTLFPVRHPRRSRWESNAGRQAGALLDWIAGRFFALFCCFGEKNRGAGPAGNRPVRRARCWDR